MKTVKQPVEVAFNALNFTDKVAMLPIMDAIAQTTKDKKDVRICLDLESAKRICKVLSDLGCRTSRGESYEDIIKSCNSQEEWHRILLKNPGVDRFRLFKVLGEELNLSLKEVKDLVDASPVEIDFTEYNVNKTKYSDILSLLQQSGATVQILKEIEN